MTATRKYSKHVGGANSPIESLLRAGIRQVLTDFQWPGAKPNIVQLIDRFSQLILKEGATDWDTLVDNDEGIMDGVSEEVWADMNTALEADNVSMILSINGDIEEALADHWSESLQHKLLIAYPNMAMMRSVLNEAEIDEAEQNDIFGELSPHPPITSAGITVPAFTLVQNAGAVTSVSCSLCGSRRTNKSTCPLNPRSKRPNPSKHRTAKKPVASKRVGGKKKRKSAISLARRATGHRGRN